MIQKCEYENKLDINDIPRIINNQTNYKVSCSWTEWHIIQSTDRENAIYINLVARVAARLRDGHEVTHRFITSEQAINLLIQHKQYGNNDNLLKKYRVHIDSFVSNNKKEIVKENIKIKLGSVLHTSWGYDQTNVEFFRIVKILGKSYFIVEEVCGDYIESGFMCGRTKATKEPLKKLRQKAYISNKGYMSICEHGYKRALYVDDGEEHYTSSYA